MSKENKMEQVCPILFCLIIKRVFESIVPNVVLCHSVGVLVHLNDIETVEIKKNSFLDVSTFLVDILSDNCHSKDS